MIRLLDRLVRWFWCPTPEDRPSVTALNDMSGEELAGLFANAPPEQKAHPDPLAQAQEYAAAFARLRDANERVSTALLGTLSLPARVNAVKATLAMGTLVEAVDEFETEVNEAARLFGEQAVTRWREGIMLARACATDMATAIRAVRA